MQAKWNAQTRTARSSSNLRTQSGEVQRRCRRVRGEKDGPRICSDFFYMSEAGVATPTLALGFSRSGRVSAMALEKKGLTQYGAKFFAGFIQQTGVRRFVNKSDGEQTMKALKDAAEKALEVVESISQESLVGDHQANGDIESTVRTLNAQMRATRFALESRLGRQLAHDDPILTWIPTFAGDTIARFRKGRHGKIPWEREPGPKWAGDSMEYGERFFTKEAKENEHQKLSRETGSRCSSKPGILDSTHGRVP